MVDMGILDDGNAEEAEFLCGEVSLAVGVSGWNRRSPEPGMFGADDTDI